MRWDGGGGGFGCVQLLNHFLLSAEKHFMWIPTHRRGFSLQCVYKSLRGRTPTETSRLLYRHTISVCCLLSFKRGLLFTTATNSGVSGSAPLQCCESAQVRVCVINGLVTHEVQKPTGEPDLLLRAEGRVSDLLCCEGKHTSFSSMCLFIVFHGLQLGAECGSN